MQFYYEDETDNDPTKLKTSNDFACPADEPKSGDPKTNSNHDSNARSHQIKSPFSAEPQRNQSKTIFQKAAIPLDDGLQRDTSPVQTEVTITIYEIYYTLPDLKQLVMFQSTLPIKKVVTDSSSKLATSSNTVTMTDSTPRGPSPQSKTNDQFKEPIQSMGSRNGVTNGMFVKLKPKNHYMHHQTYL